MKTEVRGQKSEVRRQRWAGDVVALAVLLAVAAAQAQTDLKLDWFSVDGGGGTSTGGVYSVSGTIGQPDAGTTMKGGIYSLDGGFWGAIAAVQTPGAPWLSVARTATNSVIISWPSPSAGWVLQRNLNLSTTNWVEEPTLPSDNGDTRTVTVAPPVGNRFYRLQKP